MKHQILMDGKAVSSKEQAEEIRSGGADAYDRLTKFIELGFRGSMRADYGRPIRPLNTNNWPVPPLTTSNWGQPYETFAPSQGTIKHIVCDVQIPATEWIRIQMEPYGISSREEAIDGSYDKTVESVRNAIDNNDDEALGEIPMPVLEIGLDGKSTYAEGLSRGVGVLKSSEKTIPIRVASRVYK